MRIKPSQSFLAITIQRVGLRRAADVGSFVMMWWLMQRELGHRPTVDDYADWANVSRATAYRDQQKFRDAWPEFDTPSDLALALGFDVVNDQLPSLVDLRVPREG